MVNCRICGAANPSGARTCFDCNSPFGDSSPAARRGRQSVVRRAELQVLLDCFDMCVEKRVVNGATVTGDAGMGVTTLLEAFSYSLVRRIPSKRIFFVQGRDLKTDDIFAPLRKLVISWLGLDKGEETAVCRMSLSDQIGKILQTNSATDITETTHLVGFLAGVPFPDSPILKALESDEKNMDRSLKQALIRLLAADIGREPAVFIYDDLHKSSLKARNLLVEVFKELKTVPCLCVVGGTRELKELVQDKSLVHLALEPLDNDVMRRLFDEHMPTLVDPPRELIEATIGRAAGNPGSMFQLSALLQEAGVIDTSSEPWSVDLSRLSKTDIPVTLVDAVEARIQRLDPRDREVLYHAAVFGETFWDEAIVSLFRHQKKQKKAPEAAQIWSDNLDSSTVTACLDRLVEGQFVVELPDRDIEGCVKYAFVRSSVRKLIVESLDEKKRRQQHFHAAQWASHVASHFGPYFYEVEAEHWKLAGKNHRAGLAFLGAARYARSRHSNIKAIGLFNKGLELVDQGYDLVLADGYHDLGATLAFLGQTAEAEKCFTKMLRHAWLLNHRGKAGAALNRIGRIYSSGGDAVAAKAFLNRAMALFKAADDQPGVAACLGDLGDIAGRQGKVERAFQLVSEALDLERTLDNKPAVALCLHRLGHIQLARADYPEAEGHLEEALKIRREINDVGGTAQTLSTLASIQFNRGDLENAIERWNKALAMAEEAGDRHMQGIINNNLGNAARDQGDLDRSMAYFRACEQIVTDLDESSLYAEVTRNIGILAQRMGDMESSHQYLNQSVKLANKHGAKNLEGLAYRALGDLLGNTMWDTSKVQGEDESVAYYDKALDIFQTIENQFEVARTLHSKGNHLLERGDVDNGKALLEKARDIFTKLDSKTGEKVAKTIEEIAKSVSKPR